MSITQHITNEPNQSAASDIDNIDQQLDNDTKMKTTTEARRLNDEDEVDEIS
jgi:hypothetical protein